MHSVAFSEQIALIACLRRLIGEYSGLIFSSSDCRASLSEFLFCYISVHFILFRFELVGIRVHQLSHCGLTPSVALPDPHVEVSRR